jgi:hypothetical protein
MWGLASADAASSLRFLSTFALASYWLVSPTGLDDAHSFISSPCHSAKLLERIGARAVTAGKYRYHGLVQPV